MQTESRHIRVVQKQVQAILDKRSDVLSEQKTLQILNKIRMGNLEDDDLDLANCLELAEGFDNISSVLGLEEKDYSSQLAHLRRVVERKMLFQVALEIDNAELEFFSQISLYFFDRQKMGALFDLFDQKFLRFNVRRLKISSSDSTNNLKILKTLLEDLGFVLETHAGQQKGASGILPELNGKPMHEGFVKVLKQWDRKTMDLYLSHFFQTNVKHFLSNVLESPNIKSDRIQQQFFLLNLKNFHEVFLEFDSKVQKSANLDSIVQERFLELRRQAVDDYYEGYFGVEDLYVKNTGLIYTQLMKQTLEKELGKVTQETDYLPEDPFVFEKTEQKFAIEFAQR